MHRETINGPRGDSFLERGDNLLRRIRSGGTDFEGTIHGITDYTKVSPFGSDLIAANFVSNILVRNGGL